MIVVLAGEVFYRASFTNLTSSFDDKWLSVRVILPILKVCVNLSSKQIFHVLSLILFIAKIADFT